MMHFQYHRNQNYALNLSSPNAIHPVSSIPLAKNLPRVNSASGAHIQANSEPFIEITDFKNLLGTLTLLIILDCRLFKDFQVEHIKNSQHINCRDKITKKRLASKKLTVNDLISCEETKRLILQHQEAMERLNYNKQVEFVIYDEDSRDMSDLQVEWNPLQIVLENINSSLKTKNAKILRGGFKRFCDICPEYCVKISMGDLEGNRDQRPSLRPLGFTCLNLAPINNKCTTSFSFYEDPNDLSIENEEMTQILPHLYLGNESDSSNHSKLKLQGITHILNVTRNIPFHLETTHVGEYVFKRISVNDALDQNLRQFFEEACEFIDRAGENKQKVLVHCQAGISRSPTIVIAYLMKKLNKSMNDAYNLVSDKRKIIGPNLLFMSQLSDYDDELAQARKTISLNPKFQYNNVSIYNSVSTKLNVLEKGKGFSRTYSTSSLLMDISK